MSYEFWFWALVLISSLLISFLIDSRGHWKRQAESREREYRNALGYKSRLEDELREFKYALGELKPILETASVIVSCESEDELVDALEKLHKDFTSIGRDKIEFLL